MFTTVINLEITEGNVIDDFKKKTIQMNKSSKFYSMTVQRFEQQTDEITVIALIYTIIINQISNCFNFFLKKLFQFPVL